MIREKLKYLFSIESMVKPQDVKGELPPKRLTKLQWELHGHPW